MSKTRYPGVKRLPNGRFQIRVKWTEPKTGRQREATKLIQALSPADAAAHRAKLRAEVLGGGMVPQERIRLREYAISWMSGKLPTIAESTRRHYASVLDSSVLPALGDYFLDAVTHDDIVEWRNAQTGSRVTVNTRLRFLKGMIRDAVVELKLPTDPTLRVKAVREARTDTDPNCLTADDLGRLLAHLQIHEKRWFPVLAALAYTGARFGEVTALKWTDIEEPRGLIHIQRAQWKGTVGTTKTGRTRTVPLPDALRDILREHRAQMLAEQPEGLGTGWVFLSSTGGLLHNSTAWDALQRGLTACGIQGRFTLHGFRRTLNNLLRQVTTGEVVRSVTGHVTEAMTEHYSHIGMGEKRAAIGRVISLMDTPKVGVEVGVATASHASARLDTAIKRSNH